MTKSLKNRILYKLNFLKSMGYDYHEIISITNMDVDSNNLPNNLAEFKEMVENCSLCDLSKSRKNILFGEGNADSEIMFITDEPTASEDDMKEFYVGKSGELLAKMIENVLPLKKEDIYITSLVKCKSFDGFKTSHFSSCSAYLYKQIDIIKPKIIVTLGEKCFQYLTNDFNSSFNQARGHVTKFKNSELVPMHSVGYLLRNPSSKKEAFQDMLKIKSILESI